MRRYLPVATVAIAICVLYLHNLAGVGVLGPDEPRYTAIGRAMAQSGNWITPNLWGQPWFEKPPLLYWMVAIGTKAGLGPDLCGRLPIALLSLAFLAAFFFLLKEEFGFRPASLSAGLLATSAGWLTYSSISVTDLPLTVFFSLALLLALRPTPLRFVLIGISLALAALAKGLVPLVLFLPAVILLRHYWRQFWLAVIAFIPVAIPWFAIMCARFGRAFIDEFFIRHHFQRIYSASLQHVQPWWYYGPVLLLLLFPWTPVLAFVKQKLDQRRALLLSTAAFGLFFFSVSLNKLPGYLLPLLPALYAYIGSAFEFRLAARLPRWAFLVPALLIAIVPLLTPTIAASLAIGKLSLSHATFTRTAAFYVALPILVPLLARRAYIAPLLMLCVVAAGLFARATLYPVLDRTASARGKIATLTCDNGWMRRDWYYGLCLYHGGLLPHCR